MVRIIGTPNFTFDGKMIVDYSGSSTDTKPTDNVGEGSTFTESDTGLVSIFNEDSGAWVEQFSFQG